MKRSVSKFVVGPAVAAALLAAGFSGVAAAATTGATGPSGATGATGASGPSAFSVAQQKLESQLALRQQRLADLVTDVDHATSLSSAHVGLLSARLSTEQASINALVAKVPTDQTMAQLRADRAAMLTDNRVFAVMSPQVFETINADAVLANDAADQAEESTLSSEVASLSGDAGYADALRHDRDFVSRVAKVSSEVANAEVRELAETPQEYPHGTTAFVEVNRMILRADVSLAYASYDASVISLTTGGYTGS